MTETRTGKVLKATRKHFWVEAPAGVFHCARDSLIKSAKDTTPIAVGDDVVFEILDQHEREGIITEVWPRRIKLSRKAQADPFESSDTEDVVAADIDQVVIVSSTQNPPLRSGLIDRYLIAAAKGGLIRSSASTRSIWRTGARFNRSSTSTEVLITRSF